MKVYEWPMLHGCYHLKHVAAVIDTGSDTITDDEIQAIYFDPSDSARFVLAHTTAHPKDETHLRNIIVWGVHFELLEDAEKQLAVILESRRQFLYKKHGVKPWYDRDRRLIDQFKTRIATLRSNHPHMSLEDKHRLSKIEEAFFYFAGIGEKQITFSDLIALFQSYQAAAMEATKLPVSKMLVAMEEAQDAFRKGLTEFGVAQYVDWREHDD